MVKHFCKKKLLLFLVQSLHKFLGGLLWSRSCCRLRGAHCATVEWLMEGVSEPGEQGSARYPDRHLDLMSWCVDLHWFTVYTVDVKISNFQAYMELVQFREIGCMRWCSVDTITWIKFKQVLYCHSCGVSSVTFPHKYLLIEPMDSSSLWPMLAAISELVLQLPYQEWCGRCEDAWKSVKHTHHRPTLHVEKLVTVTSCDIQSKNPSGAIW